MGLVQKVGYYFSLDLMGTPQVAEAGEGELSGELRMGAGQE